uniref:LAGLIDADG endonuclease n=1 Tax=Ganoderma lingzhi TaxID=1233435 RepID=A0A8K1V1L2_9APHY|nr:hypothetical protein MYE56_mgp22 [Ganoderma lingzhi]UDY67668.1 hypothetical protein [Ganoderma lingzhi]UDY67702.1 hypothetical protein [Ganoderma lingzhi]UDY67737.1 hypothetical protein [Ganoderma lingzhi]UDY67774.1 hypothetical protein [Ganoderma lingzhi]UOL49711.1 hypothetical protein [Ganoderma lingzhi]
MSINFIWWTLKTKILQIISRSAYNAKVRSKLNGYIGGTNTSIAGVYIWPNLKTGEQNIGSSINLYTRLISYFKPSILNEGNRLINQSMKTFRIDNFKLDIYVKMIKNKNSCAIS